jgi:hypothetical protein
MKKERMMSKVAVCMMVALLLLGLTSCGDDGKDGKPYLKLSWDGAVLYYLDDIPGTPDPVYNNTYYECAPGTYTFEYIHGNNDDYIWSGTITMTKGKDGEDGGLFSDGDDGDDIYYEIMLYGFVGPVIYEHGTTQMKQVEESPAEGNGSSVQRIVRNGWVITLEIEKREQ